MLITLVLTTQAQESQNCDERMCAYPGVNIDFHSCDQTQIDMIVNAARNILPIVKAARAHVLAHHDDGLFNAFFLPGDTRVVRRGLRNLQRILGKETASILFQCDDPESWEQTHQSYAVNGMYVVPKHNRIPNISYIWLLSRYWMLDPKPSICGDAVETMVSFTDRTTIMLHELLHIRYLGMSGFEMLQDPPHGDRYTMDVAIALRRSPSPSLKPIDD